MADYTQQGLYQEGNSLFDDIFAFGDLEVQNINVVGIITAKTFSGVDATSLKDDGGTVKIQATTTGATHSGRAVFNEVELQGKVYDSDGDFGTSGQVLSSDGTDVEWVNAGSLSAGAAAQVSITDDANSNSTRFLTFVDASSGNNQVKTDSQLTYNPSTNTINTVNIAGNVTGTILTASQTNITSVGTLTGLNVSGVAQLVKGTSGGATSNTDAGLILDNNSNVYIQFRGPATNEQGLLFGDNADNDSGNIIYDHSDNALTIATNGGTNERLRVNATGLSVTGSISASNGFSGNLTGNVTGNLTGAIQTAAQTNITSVGTLTGLTVDGNVILDSTSNYLHIKGALYDKDGQSGSADQVLVSTGTQVDWKSSTDLTSGASIKITISESDTNSDFPITFSAAPGQSGGNTLLSDNQFTYNASSNTVTAGTFSGSGASLTSLNASNLGSGTVANARLSNSSLFVTGMIMMYNGSSAPSGWAICNGSNGTPDLRDRFIVGTGSSYSLGNTGGANSVTLTLNQIPAHTHTYERTDVGINVNDRPWPASNNDCDMTNQNTSSAGGGQSHENRPPYYALMFIMKL